MSEIHVCPLSSLETVLVSSRAQHMMTLMGPGKSVPKPAQIAGQFLALEFNDIGEPQEGLIAPSEHDVRQIVDFGRSWNGNSNLVVHCWFGVSRSTAAALLIQAALSPENNAASLADRLRTLSPIATPNPLMIKHGDRLLGFDGKLVEAVAAIGRGAEASQGEPFIWAMNA